MAHLKSSSTPTIAKIFVGGISWELTDAAFTSFFSRFGEIKEAQIMRDKDNGNSRGFGFVNFADPASVDKVLSQDLELDGRKIDCKIAVPREEIGSAPGMHRTRKVFVGGLNPQTSQEEFKAHFAQFGNVVNAIIMIDHSTGRSRGFGFVTYDSESAVDVVTARSHTISNKVVETKRAVPKGKIVSETKTSGRGRSLPPPPPPFDYYYPPYPPPRPYGPRFGHTGPRGADYSAGGYGGQPTGGQTGQRSSGLSAGGKSDGYGDGDRYGSSSSSSSSSSSGGGYSGASSGAEDAYADWYAGAYAYGAYGPAPYAPYGPPGAYYYGPVPRPGGGARAGGAYSAGSYGGDSRRSAKPDRSFHPYSR